MNTPSSLEKPLAKDARGRGPPHLAIPPHACGPHCSPRPTMVISVYHTLYANDKEVSNLKFLIALNSVCLGRTCLCSLSYVQLFETPWTVTHQAPLSMEICQVRILEWVVISSSRGSSQPRIEPASLAVPALADGNLPLHHLGSPILEVHFH